MRRLVFDVKNGGVIFEDRENQGEKRRRDRRVQD